MVGNLKKMKRLAEMGGFPKRHLKVINHLIENERAFTKWDGNRRRRLERRAIQEVLISKRKSIFIIDNRQFFIPCTSVAPLGLIEFRRIPPHLRGQVECMIELYLVHETLHIVLYILGEYEAVKMLDLISTPTGDFQIGRLSREELLALQKIQEMKLEETRKLLTQLRRKH